MRCGGFESGVPAKFVRKNAALKRGCRNGRRVSAASAVRSAGRRTVPDLERTGSCAWSRSGSSATPDFSPVVNKRLPVMA